MREQSTFLRVSNQPENEANIKPAVTKPSILKIIPLEAKQYGPITRDHGWDYGHAP